MPSNADEFALKLRGLMGELTERELMPRLRTFAFKVLEGAVNLSPVNTGQLRAGWHVSVGVGSDIDSGTSLLVGKEQIDGAEFGESIFIQNNVPHAAVIEFGLFQPPDPGPSEASHVPRTARPAVAGQTLVRGGFHVSAPRGMLADSVQTAVDAFKSGAF